MHEDNKPDQSALELRLKQITRYVSLGLLGVLALCALLFLYIGTVKQSEADARQTSQVQADVTKDSDTCKIYPEQELCVLARQIAANPTEAVIPKDGKDGEKGETGSTGATGKGVSSFVTNEEGNLIVTFSDGTTQNAGKVVGKNGIDGINGTNGTNGRGILSAGLDAGNLIIRYTDGTTENVGMVVGPAGQQGVQGEAGQNGKDGTNGTNGTDGISVTNLTVDDAGYVQVSYSNGTTQTAGRVIINTIRALSCTNDMLTITMMDNSTLSTPVDCSPDTIGPPAAAAPAPSTAPLVKIP